MKLTPHTFDGFQTRAPRLEVFNGNGWLCVDSPRRVPGLVSLAEAIEEFRVWRTAIEASPELMYGRARLAREWGLRGVVLWYGREVVACELDETAPYRNWKGHGEQPTQQHIAAELILSVSRLVTDRPKESTPLGYEDWLGFARDAWDEIDIAIALRGALKLEDDEEEDD